jgi:hypothetical protein
MLIDTADTNTYALWKLMSNCGRPWNNLFVEGEKLGYS